MRKPVLFPYKTYKNQSHPIIQLGLYQRNQWFETEAYVDSGATFSLFSPLDAQRIGLEYTRGKKVFSVVGNGTLIAVYLNRLSVRLGNIVFKATIGFSPELGVGFNLLGRRDFFTVFDVTFSDATRTITFLPRK